MKTQYCRQLKRHKVPAFGIIELSRNKNTIGRFLCPIQFTHKILTVRNFIMQSPLFFGHSASKNCSADIMVGKDRNIPAKIICVRNKRNNKDWIAFICTNPTLFEEKIICLYGKRWQIAFFFKTCKAYLQLVSECHSRSFDALTDHTAIVFTRYFMIAMEQRRCEDERTLGEIFFFFTDELADITFGESFRIIMIALIESVCAIFQPTEEQLALFIEMVVGRLPKYIRSSLAKAALTA